MGSTGRNLVNLTVPRMDNCLGCRGEKQQAFVFCSQVTVRSSGEVPAPHGAGSAPRRAQEVWQSRAGEHGAGCV